jgi:membrane protease YdiL (CAAX protease family)
MAHWHDARALETADLKHIGHIFWNRREDRPRMLCRLAAFGVGYVLFVILFLLIAKAIIWACLGGQSELPEDWEAVVESVGSIAAVCLAGRVLDRRPFTGFGLRFDRDWAIDFGFGLALGGLLISTVFLVQLAAGWVEITGTWVTAKANTWFWAAFALSAFTFALIGFAEELLFRGYVLTNLAEGFHFKSAGARGALLTAILFSVVIFGALHLSNAHTSTISTISVCLGGVLLALGYILTGSLAIPIGLHITWNLFQTSIFGFPVSGERFSGTTMLATLRNGPRLWVGDEFGPESGLIALAAVVLGCLLIVSWVRLRYGQVRLCTAIAEPPLPDPAAHT